LIGPGEGRDGHGKLPAVPSFDRHPVAVDLQHAGLHHPPSLIAEFTPLALPIERLRPAGRMKSKTGQRQHKESGSSDSDHQEPPGHQFG
jgi:hypothetical protein